MIRPEVLKAKAAYMANMATSELHVEQGYRKALESALKYTDEQIKGNKLDKAKYFEAVTRALYYMGYFDREKLVAEELRSKKEKK